MESRERLWSQSEFAREIGTDRFTVAGLVDLLRIETVPHPGVPNAKAIRDRDARRIRHAIAAGLALAS